MDYYFKKTSGVVRFIKQLISISLSGIIFLYLFCNSCYEYGARVFFIKIRKTLLISLIFVSIYGFLEFMIISLDWSFLRTILNIFDYLPFVEIRLDYHLHRISSLTYEPPALGTYLITISGFMFTYVLTSKKLFRFVPFLLVIILAILSKSRTALVVVFIQILTGVFLAYKLLPRFRRVFNKVSLIGFIYFSIFLVFNSKSVYTSIESRIDSLNFSKNLDYNTSEYAVSNKSRLGIQYAILQVFKESPILGVGWGQQAFESKSKYPKWALKNNYEFPTKYLNENLKSFPPGYNLYLRILAETGLIGFLIFSLFILQILLSTYKLCKRKSSQRYIAIGLFISFVGFLFNWLQIDSFRIYGFWICLAILIVLYKELLNEKYYSTDTSLQ
ncbi:O-antigen ligase [Aquimarina sp. RZ0]|uniref:O-antigen ligase family protein n=1 Tax=Aquimarina sp. RZ0 TaxID=2607730 RepID=UPI0011F397FF|nr:O-antigen ligase family protein [Aquimarina sp. RZ0]KAA1244327.1 O-antigen ligase family protein [Aquimarina sp. RZ0]